MITLTVGIPAYNAGLNIDSLLSDVAAQDTKTFKLSDVMVYDDVSSDDTAQRAARHASKPSLTVGTGRRGFAHAVQYLLNHSKSDIVVLLNDDIRINDRRFLEKLVKPFLRAPRLGLACGNPQPNPGTNFVERAVVSSWRAYEKAKFLINDGNNALTCDGKSMAFSRRFINDLKFPRNYAHMGNVDTYVYCMCRKLGYDYRIVRDAAFAFNCPSTVADLTRWTLRNNKSMALMRRRFGEILEEDTARLKYLFARAKIAEFRRNPAGCLLLFMVTLYCSVHLKLVPPKHTATWKTVSTTKSIVSASAL